MVKKRKKAKTVYSLPVIRPDTAGMDRGNADSRGSRGRSG